MRALKKGRTGVHGSRTYRIRLITITIDQVKQILHCKLQGEASARYKSMPNKKASIDAIWTWMDDRFINLMHRMNLETRLMKMVQRPGQSVEDYKCSLLTFALRAIPKDQKQRDKTLRMLAIMGIRKKLQPKRGSPRRRSPILYFPDAGKFQTDQ